MEFDGIVSLVSNVGMAFTVTIYFLVRDWKFQTTAIEAQQSLKDAVEALKEMIQMLHRGDA